MVSVTVIMPVYNSERYLVDAVKSVLNQSFDSFELILIDDGSTDSSGKICDNFVQADKRVCVYHQTNRGMCAARNFGLKVARGEYVCFIDNDDLYKQDLLNDNYRLAKLHDADVVKFGRSFETRKNDKVIYKEVSSVTTSKLVVTANELEVFFPTWMHFSGWPTVWNAMYKREFLIRNNLFFNEMHHFGHEDIEFNILLYPKIETLVINPKTYYVWIKRVGQSASSKFDNVKFASMFYVLKLKKNLLSQMNADAQLYTFVMIEELSWFMGYINHPNSNLNKKEIAEIYSKFFSIIGKIKPSKELSWKQLFTVSLYNARLFRLLNIMKKSFNYIRNKEDF